MQRRILMIYNAYFFEIFNYGTMACGGFLLQRLQNSVLKTRKTSSRHKTKQISKINKALCMRSSHVIAIKFF